MAQRLLKIILPESHGSVALDILAEQEITDFWQEESLGENHVVSVLIDSGQPSAGTGRYPGDRCCPGSWLQW